VTTTPSPRELVEAFRARTIAHPILRQVDVEARQAVTALNSKNIVLIYGPTGVGKTTLIRRIKRALDEEIADELRADTTRAMVPIVGAVAPEATTFSWKDFYARTLEALDHPYAQAQVRSAGPRPNSNDLRRRLENTLQATRPRAVIVD
jgi:energy-coupling factor transporter ATP-binding protein EcfA2